MKDRGKLDAQTIDEQQQQHQPISSNFPQYLYKFLLGGILLLELVIYEPYFGLKIYTFESMRLRALSHRTMNSQVVLDTENLRISSEVLIINAYKKGYLFLYLLFCSSWLHF